MTTASSRPIGAYIAFTLPYATMLELISPFGGSAAAVSSGTWPIAHFSDRARWFQRDPGRRFSVIVDDHGSTRVRGFIVSVGGVQACPRRRASLATNARCGGQAVFDGAALARLEFSRSGHGLIYCLRTTANGSQLLKANPHYWLHKSVPRVGCVARPTLAQSRRVHWRCTSFLTPALWRSLNK